VDELKPVAEVFYTDSGADVPQCDILVDYCTNPETPKLEEGDELIQRKALPPKFECGFCDHTFRSELDDPRCPDCGQANWQCYVEHVKVKKLEESGGENSE